VDTVTCNYANTFVAVLGVLAGAAMFAGLIQRFLPLLLVSPLARSLWILAGTLALTTAGLGRLGWGIQSFGGTTPPELLDQTVFWCLSLFGVFCIAVPETLAIFNQRRSTRPS